MDYKADITLNERDTLFDMLATEKNLVKIYADALTQGLSKGFIKLATEHLKASVTDRTNVFLLMTNEDYARVVAATDEVKYKIKAKFKKVCNQLS